MIGLFARRTCASSTLSLDNRNALRALRFLSAIAPSKSSGVKVNKRKSNAMRKPQQDFTPANGPAPPWVRNKAEYESQYWLGRKAALPPWAKENFQKLVENENIDGWDSFFNGREQNLSGVNTLMRVFLARDQPKKALTIFEEMKKREFVPDKYAYLNAISACADLKDSQRGLTFFQKLKEEFGVDRKAISAVMMCHSAVGDVEKAESVLKEAISKGMKPDRVIFTALLTAYAKQGNLAKSLEILQEMRMAHQHPDVVAYNAVLHACARAGDGFKALDIFDEMRQFAIPRDVRAYNAVIQACTMAGLEDDGPKLLNEMLANKYEGDGSIAPTRYTYTIIIQSFANKGDLESATSMLASMIEEGIPADAKAHAALLDACIFNAAWETLIPRRIMWAERADALFESAMRSLPQPLDPADAQLLLTKLLCTWALTNDAQLVRTVLSRFQEFPGAKVGPLVFAALLNMCERCCDGRLATETLAGMEKAGLTPSASFWCRAALAHVRGKDVEGGLAILRRARERGVKVSSCGEWKVLPEALGSTWVPPNDWEPAADAAPSAQEIRAYQAALAAIKA